MKPLQTSSGDLTADRRNDYAEMLFGSGEHAAAAELMLSALELAPGWTLGWFRLGEMQEAAGMAEAAAHAWRMALNLDPDDRAGAGLKLALIGRTETPAAPPSGFVEALFDQYADKFDDSLVNRLGYRVPDLLASAIAATGRAPFGLALDLGCGTGLMGERLRPLAKTLAGFDISAGMLSKAARKRVYDRLEKADLQAFAWDGPKADLVVAADVFMYLGALDGIFSTVAGLLAPGSVFAFSVEAHDGPEDFVLGETRRYSHSEGNLRRLLSEHGLTVLSLERTAIRQDRNAPVEGLIVVAESVPA